MLGLSRHRLLEALCPLGLLLGCGPAGMDGVTIGAASDPTVGPTTASTIATVTTTAADTGGTETDGDGYDTDYPVGPECDEGDEGFSEDETFGGGSSSGGGEDTGQGMGDIPLGATIFEIQGGIWTSGDFVEVTDVVVIAPPVLSADGSTLIVYVQEAEGGPQSGINLRIPAPGGAAADLQRSDEITVIGTVVNRYVFASLEVTPFSSITQSGRAPIPPPVAITPDMVEPGSQLAEDLESVLITVQDVHVVDPDPCDGEVEVEADIHLDDRFLQLIGETIPIPPEGTYVQVSGPLIYTYGGFEVAPRDLDDISF